MFMVSHAEDIATGEMCSAFRPLGQTSNGEDIVIFVRFRTGCYNVSPMFYLYR